MSRVITHFKKINDLGVLDSETILDQTLQMNPNKLKAIQVCQLHFSSNIPNIFNVGTTNTGLVRCSKDGGTNWDVIQLDTGIYTIPLVQAAILNKISPYWTDALDVGFSLRYNTATYVCYIDIDSSKMPSGQFCIDFNYSDSKIGELLGFVTTSLFNTDGIHEASNYAKLDWFGNSVVVELDLGVSLQLVNGKSSKEICRVPLTADVVSNEYTYPDKFIAPWFILPTLHSLNKFKVSLKSDDATKQLVVMEGSITLLFQIKEI